MTGMIIIIYRVTKGMSNHNSRFKPNDLDIFGACCSKLLKERIYKGTF